LINTRINHIEFNIDEQNLPFYSELLGFLGWTVWVDEPEMLIVGNAQNLSLGFNCPAKNHQNNYDGPGMNHLGLAVDSQAAVDEMVNYLRTKGIPPLFNTPRHRPEFADSPNDTYYQVMFETPDRILFEIVYIGSKEI
jgi:catechol 2,3-dioxygenase-like lactoylglutathione lyase family enzyme